jgi:hypothetical protein
VHGGHTEPPTAAHCGQRLKLGPPRETDQPEAVAMPTLDGVWVALSGKAGRGVSINLPYVDEHAITIAVPRDQVWTALQRYVATSIGISGSSPVARILGAAPRSGFRVVEEVPGDRLTLGGHHRFSRYELVFKLDGTADGGTVLRAQTYAAFPGLHGRIYRVLVIGTRAHVLATSHMLHAVRQISTAGDGRGAAGAG